MRPGMKEDARNALKRISLVEIRSGLCIRINLYQFALGQKVIAE
jgi:hypothetical protein